MFYRRHEIRFVFSDFLTFFGRNFELQNRLGTPQNVEVRFVDNNVTNFTETSVKTIDTFKTFDVEYEDTLFVESQNEF